MSASHHPAQPGQLIPLTEDECWDLVRSAPVGRLAWEKNGEVTVIPVNFQLSDDRALVRIRTSPYSALARDCTDREVAFEVDHIDAEHRGGWSVLIHGRCHHDGRAGDGPEPWAAGARMLGLQVEVRAVTGRRVVGD